MSMAEGGFSPHGSGARRRGHVMSEKSVQTMRPVVRGNLNRVLKFITCPHCWHRFQSCDILWVARHQDLRGDLIVPDAMVRFRPSRFTPAGDALDARGMACQELACPRCHLVIPRVMLENEPLIFSLVGVPSSGKSYLVASMTHQCRRMFPTRFKLAFEDADTLTNRGINSNEQTLFEEDEEKLVYIEKTNLTGDQYRTVVLSDQRIFLPTPFLFNVKPASDHVHADRAERMNQLLCLYDNAGEHFHPGEDTTLAPGTLHVARARVLMFLYDPIQDPALRRKCQTFSRDPQLFESVRTAQQSTIVIEMAKRVRTYAHLPPHRKVNQPLLVLVCKSDIWGPLIEGEDLLSEPYLNGAADGGQVDAPMGARIDFERIERVSRKIRDMLMRYTPEFVTAVEGFSNRVVYLPVSPLGRSPESRKTDDGTTFLAVRPKDIRPAWVTVPIVYAFAKWSNPLFQKHPSGVSTPREGEDEGGDDAPGGDRGDVEG